MVQILGSHWRFASYRNDSTLTGPSTGSKVSEGIPVGSALCNGLLHLESVFLSIFQLYFAPSLHCVSDSVFDKLYFLHFIICISLTISTVFLWVKSMREEFPLDLHFALTRTWGAIKWEEKRFRRSLAGAGSFGTTSRPWSTFCGNAPGPKTFLKQPTKVEVSGLF